MTRPFLSLANGVPELSDDVKRNIAKGYRRLTTDKRWAHFTFTSDPADIRRLRQEITLAYAIRCLETARHIKAVWWEETYDRVQYLANQHDPIVGAEVSLLRIDGHLAAWDIAVFDTISYTVLAGQMMTGFNRYRPGRLLEAKLIEHVANVKPSPEWHMFALCHAHHRFMTIYWGEGEYHHGIIAQT